MSTRFNDSTSGLQARAVDSREFDCWECGSSSRAPAHGSRDFKCPHCGQRIELADVVVMEQRVRRIRTLGELRLVSGAFLVAGDSICGALRLMGGSFVGRVHALGEVRMESGELDLAGELTCESLSIGPKAKLSVQQPLRCQHAEIRGQFRGELICSGIVRLANGAQLAGHCRAGSLMMEPGANLAASVTMTGSGRQPSAREPERPRSTSTSLHERQLPEAFYTTSLPRPC